MTRKKPLPPAREYAPGIGRAVADRTVNRKVLKSFKRPKKIKFAIPRDDSTSLEGQLQAWAKNSGYAYDGDYHVAHGDDVEVKGHIVASGETRFEDWEDVARRVAAGNSLLCPDPKDQSGEFDRLHHHLRQASLLMSGRHLQHGDETQPTRNQEVFTNCATAPTSFLLFYLLLNGSGVGRSYDDRMMAVDWNNMPIVVPVIDWQHKDVQSGRIFGMDARTAEHLYAGRKIVKFKVPDSREGWAQAVEIIERMTYEGVHRETVLLIDFSDVRPYGAPIGGMQNRPASGPGPLMAAIQNVARVRDSGMEPWRATMYIDHYLAECVLVGGARRSARMATKTWRDLNVLDFIGVKKGGFMWSSNNSVTVDAEFWRYVYDDAGIFIDKEMSRHAKEVFAAITEAAYHDGTGEPGLINQDQLVENNEGMEVYKDGKYAGSKRFVLMEETLPLMIYLAHQALGSPFKMITNPCGEIALFMLGGYCVIADVVPYHAGLFNWTGDYVRPSDAAWDDDAEDAFRTAVRALMRTNLMDSLYHVETARTNRIGVGMTGFHEYALARFGYGFRDLINEDYSRDFWMLISRFARAVSDEAVKYAAVTGQNVPHTNRTIKPAGTTSKLFALTEGVHLPSMREYLRWVQFRNDDPLVKVYEELGYPVKRLRTYAGTTVVGFPTKPEIIRLADSLGMSHKVVTAGEATPEEQYRFLQLLEKYWIVGVNEDGSKLSPDTGNQVSYTLKFVPSQVDFEEFEEMIQRYQPTVRACSVMPQGDTSAYEYQPEQPVTKAEFELIAAAIKADQPVNEDVDFEHVDCSTGACPVDFSKSA